MGTHQSCSNLDPLSGTRNENFISGREWKTEAQPSRNPMLFGSLVKKEKQYRENSIPWQREGQNWIDKFLYECRRVLAPGEGVLGLRQFLINFDLFLQGS